jgi:hypothetical protein
MSTPKPPFYNTTDELLYNILLALPSQNGTYLRETDINTLAKLNAILTDTDLMKAEEITSAINALKGNVPEAGNTLEKLFNIIQGLQYLKREDIDTLAELNAILSDADVLKANDLQSAVDTLKGNVPVEADSLQKLFDLLKPVLSAWLPGGNEVAELKPIGTTSAFALPFITGGVERLRITEDGKLLIGNINPFAGLEGYRVQITTGNVYALGVSGSSFFQGGNFNVNLGKEGSSDYNTFRINTYIAGLAGFDFAISKVNQFACLEITDLPANGSKPEMIRISPAGYADTAILLRPHDVYNTKFGYKYLLEGTNESQKNRFVSAFHAQISFPSDDVYPGDNIAYLFNAFSRVTNHHITGFFADVRGNNPNAETYGFRSIASRIFFDGNGMSFNLPVAKITTDSSAHPLATALLKNGSYVSSCALFLTPLGEERTGLIISPGAAQANGLFISPQQALNTYNYDGYLMWIQYSTTGNLMHASTDKPLLYLRKHNAVLNGFDHTGAFIRMEENIGSSGAFIEAYQYDEPVNLTKLKFAISKEGVLSLGKVVNDPQAIDYAGRLYFLNDELRFIRSDGQVMIVQAIAST